MFGEDSPWADTPILAASSAPRAVAFDVDRAFDGGYNRTTPLRLTWSKVCRSWYLADRLCPELHKAGQPCQQIGFMGYIAISSDLLLQCAPMYQMEALVLRAAFTSRALAVSRRVQH